VAVKAVAGALKRHPPFNATLDPWREEIVYKRFCNVGVAVATDRGLIVPVVRDADRKSVVEIAEEVRSLAGRARDGTLGLDELRGGTFTITNIGALGGTGFVPAIRYPESAILGMGRVAEKPVVRDGQVVVRTLLPLVLSFDHRIADGADAARFVNTVSAWLADPARMLVEV
jgi:pyruvate dehydrogenase E2 component (dihydrolipoamide acetyltransferase)